GTNSVERFDEQTGEPAPAPGQTGATFIPMGTAGLNHPLGLLIGPRDGLLYVSNLETNQVFRFDADTGDYVDAVVDGDSQVQDPAGIISGPDRKLYLANTGNNRILRYDVSQPGSPGELVADLGTMGVTGMVFGPDGLLYVNTRFSNGVMRCDVRYLFCEDFVS